MGSILIPFKVIVFISIIIFIYLTARILCFLHKTDVSEAYKNEKLMKQFKYSISLLLYFFFNLFGIFHIEKKNIKVDVNKYPELKFFSENSSKVILTNHVSFLDIPIFLYMESTCFISKKSVSTYPIIGIVAQFIQCLFLE